MLERILLGSQPPPSPQLLRGVNRGDENISAWINGRREKLRFRVGDLDLAERESGRIELTLWQSKGERNSKSGKMPTIQGGTRRARRGNAEREQRWQEIV